MKPENILFSLAAALFFLVSCGSPQQKPEQEGETKGTESLLKYAKRFRIRQSGSTFTISLFGNRHNHDVTDVFVVGDDTSGLATRNTNARVIQAPCKKVAALSSIYVSMLAELQALDALAAIDNMDYIVNPAVIKRHQAHPFPQLARSPRIDIEQAVALKPDVLFTFGMGEGDKDRDKKLEQTGIPVVISVDHLEESPLARAEWLKFFAVFVGRLSEADSIFKQVEKNYLYLKSMAQTADKRPTVFSEIKYSEFWYMPGGKSYVAQLMANAGARYLWDDNKDFGSLPLSFEQVYARAKDADYWINLSTLNTKKELLAGESRYAGFRAFRSGNLYNNNLHTNAFGYSDYWETGMIYPDRILSDLISIFHPYLRKSQKQPFFYYKQLK